MHHAEEGFAEDAAVHLRGTQLAVDENHRYFGNLEAALVGGELHLNLEGIPLEADFVQFDGFEHLTAVALESGSGVVDGQAGDDAHILGGEVGHEHASHGPVHYVHAADVTRADGHVVTFCGTFVVKARKVGRCVAEVGIHLEDVVILMLDGPLESGDVGGAEAELSLAFHHEEAVGEFLLHAAHDVGSAVGRVVLDDEYVEILFKTEYRTDNVLDIFLFVISRYDDNAV